MKKVFLFAAMLAIAASCTVSEIDSIKGTTAPEITASYENNDTKTTITTDAEGVGTIWWKPADEINVFYGTLSTHYTSKNTENATTVAFGTTDIIGSTESASENIWGLYPYNENAVCDGESVTTTIPAAQQAIAGSFDDDIFTSLAHSTSTVMTFYNVLGGIKFSLSRDDIQTITFKGNNDEDIAGKVKLEMDANGKPVAEITEGEKTITLTPKEGTTFAKNTNYYIVMLPTVLSNGFTMTFETKDEVGTFEYTTKSIEIKRSVFSKKENIDTYATFVGKAPEYEYVDLGLDVMWATCNLGANSPEEDGGYYQWAGLQDVTDRNIFLDFNNCPYHIGSSYSSGWTKYIFTDEPSYWSGMGDPDNKSVLDLEDDVAHVTLGGKWRIPSESEFELLLSNCTSEWTTLNGVSGRKFTSKANGNSIFLPAANYRISNYCYNYSSGHYMSSSLNDMSTISANELYFSSNSVKISNIGREYGSSVRPVYGDIINVTGISLNKSAIALVKGNIESLISTISPLNAYNKHITWSSNNPEIATVKANGMVTAITPGTAIISVKSQDGDFTATCVVIVLSESVPVPEAVDLGLPSGLKWASFNLGANNPQDLGGYYQWAGLQDYKNDVVTGRPYYTSGSGWTKYVPINQSSYWSGSGSPDNKTVLDPGDDVAHVMLGGKWRMPTKADFDELKQYCTSTNVGAGVKFTSEKNGNSIILRAAGNKSYSEIKFAYECGYYWSSSLNPNYYDPSNAYYFFIGEYDWYMNQDSRWMAMSIRPVLE